MSYNIKRNNKESDSGFIIECPINPYKKSSFRNSLKRGLIVLIASGLLAGAGYFAGYFTGHNDGRKNIKKFAPSLFLECSYKPKGLADLVNPNF